VWTLSNSKLKNLIPQKQQRKIVLLHDGRTSHCIGPDNLDLALKNYLIFVYLLHYCTHYLQSLDRRFFISLKQFFYKAMYVFAQSHSGHKSSKVTLCTIVRGDLAESCNTVQCSFGVLIFVACTYSVQRRYQRKHFQSLMVFCAPTDAIE
jgi:hypothetical protein